MQQTAGTVVDWQAVGNLFLDMDGTLLDLHFDNYFWREYLPRCYGERHGLSLDQARTELRPRFRAVEGTLDWYCADYWSSELGLDVLALTIAQQELIRLHVGVEDWLQRAQAAGKHLVLLTNAHPGVLSIKLQHTGLARYFDRIVSAHALGHPKETPGFWQGLRVLETCDLTSALFVDDSLPVLRAAHAAGVGRLIAICKPDSQEPARDIREFPAVETVAELMP